MVGEYDCVVWKTIWGYNIVLYETVGNITVLWKTEREYDRGVWKTLGGYDCFVGDSRGI